MTANRTVFDIPLTWNRTRFEATRNKCRFARKLIEISINVQFEKQIRGVFCKNIDIEENINDINEHLFKYHDKLRVLDNMIELASQSLRIYFDKRMEHVRSIVNEHCNLIQQIIHEEAEHWKEIHAVMNQNLINPGDVRSRNNHPRTVQKSPALNIHAIDEADEEEEEEQVSNLLNGKTLTPLLTQMIRKSRLQSKRFSSSININIQSENSVPRKQERYSIHILPLSTTRQPLQIVDTTFVVKPEDATMDGEMHDDNDDPNGTYRARANHYHHLYLPERTLIRSQPHIPARLCFSPTILQDATISPEDDESLSDNEKPTRKFLRPVDQNQTNIIRTKEDIRRFGQTFSLDMIKTENIGDDQIEYARPAIPDDDVLVLVDTNSLSTYVPCTTNDNYCPRSDKNIVQETVPTKSRTRVTTKTKSKPVIVSARKTRSATKDIAEREAAVVKAKTPVEKPIENKRKTRKRKQSKSIDRRVETSDDENENPQSNSTTNNKRKTKKRKKSNSDHHHFETSDDEPSSNSTRLTTNKRKTHQSKKSKEQETSDNDHNKPTKRSKSKISTNDKDEKKTKKHKRKSRRSKKDDEEQISDQTKHYSTRSPTKRGDHRQVRPM